MLNIEDAQDSFWQFARFWKDGETSKFKLSCQNGILDMIISARIGHPDHMHFPPPPHVPHPPSVIKRKSPSQLRRQVRRQEKQAEKTPNNNLKETEAEAESNVTLLQLSLSPGENGWPDCATPNTNKNFEFPHQLDEKYDVCESTFPNKNSLECHIVSNHIEYIPEKICQVTDCTNISDNFFPTVNYNIHRSTKLQHLYL